MEITKHIDIKAVPKPRQTRSDKWKERPCVMAYRAFADELRYKFGPVPYGASSVTLSFFIKMPKTWGKKKQSAMFGTYHQQKPDADNLLKAVLDALLPEDKGIARIECEKLWDDKDGISITLWG